MQDSFVNTLTLGHPLQQRLGRLPKPPEQLFYTGTDPNTYMHTPLVAIVGTRKPTAYGMHTVQRLVRELVAAGATIVSGLAFGIDIVAHTETLKQQGNTIAVLPSDLHYPYPASHRTIAADIIQSGGTLISEHTDCRRPRADQFLERNRIIAALCDAVCIPEAAQRSGSLNTARHAYELGIPVFATPGRTDDPMSAGTNHLIATLRAHLLDSTTHIRNTLGLTHNDRAQRSIAVLSQIQQRVLDTIVSGTTSSTLIQHTACLDTATMQTTLTELEIQGHITQTPSGEWSAVNSA